jgi:acyl-CoA thioesterase
MPATQSDTRTPQQTAEAVRDAMQANDAVLHTLGMTLGAVGPGQATVSMTVRADMLNGFAICHGGLVSTLADTAFAYACNSYDELTVAAGFSVELLAPSHEGDVLTAVASEANKSGRTGLYDIEVRNQHGKRVALFRGRSYTMKGRPVVGGAPVAKAG